MRKRRVQLRSDVSARCISSFAPARVCKLRLRRHSAAGTPSLDTDEGFIRDRGQTVLVDCAQPIARVGVGMADSRKPRQ